MMILAGTVSRSEETFDAVTGRVSLSYAFSDHSNLYASISEGFRSGGFNPLSTQPDPFDPETILTYEIGSKAVLLSGRLKVEWAVFLSEYEDYQASSQDPGTGVIRTQNPGEAEITGVEVSTQFNLDENISVGFDGSVIDTEFTKVDPGFSIVNVGDPISHVAEYDYSVFGNLQFDWSTSVKGYARISYSRQGPIFETIRTCCEQSKTEAMGFLDAQIGADWDAFSFRLYGHNLNNESRALNASVFNQFLQQRPRSIGVDIKYTF